VLDELLLPLLPVDAQPDRKRRPAKDATTAKENIFFKVYLHLLLRIPGKILRIKKVAKNCSPPLTLLALKIN